MARLALPDVTLACVDTRAPRVACKAIAHCLEQATFARVVLFTDAAACATLPPDIEGVPVSIGSVNEYSAFMLRGLAAHIHTPFVMIVQWDGYVLDAGAWHPGFLDCDYIGAPFRTAPHDWLVGNGGFSLRSARLLSAMQDPAIVIGNPEDTCICHANRERLVRDFGIHFASPALAEQFSFERVAPNGPTFGFHGLFNFHRVMSPDALRDFLLEAPDELVFGVDGRDLCRALIADDQLDLATMIIAKRHKLGLFDNRTMRLRVALQRARLARQLGRVLPARAGTTAAPDARAVMRD